MANKGFRQECKFIEKEIGNVKILANPSGYDGNIHAVINCCNTGGKNPIDFSLIYNHSNRNENIGYGKGLLDNFYREIIISGDECIIKSSDGATYSTTKSVNSKEIWINRDKNYIYDTFVLRNYNNIYFHLNQILYNHQLQYLILHMYIHYNVTYLYLNLQWFHLHLAQNKKKYHHYLVLYK